MYVCICFRMPMSRTGTLCKHNTCGMYVINNMDNLV